MNIRNSSFKVKSEKPDTCVITGVCFQILTSYSAGPKDRVQVTFLIRHRSEHDEKKNGIKPDPFCWVGVEEDSGFSKQDISVRIAQIKTLKSGHSLRVPPL